MRRIGFSGCYFDPIFCGVVTVLIDVRGVEVGTRFPSRVGYISVGIEYRVYLEKFDEEITSVSKEL